MEKFKIIGVRLFTWKDKAKVGLVVEGREKPIPLSEKQVQAASGLQGNFKALIGSTISASFYQEGEDMGQDNVCNKSGVIVKEFDITLSDRLQNFFDAAAAGVGLFGSIKR